MLFSEMIYSEDKDFFETNIFAWQCSIVLTTMNYVYLGVSMHSNSTTEQLPQSDAQMTGDMWKPWWCEVTGAGKSMRVMAHSRL